ncbi:MAG: phosphatidylserine decarboxylase [Wolbachia endosymbiont of Menacanthus eurysternus]|nr:MAG: phosphatidylserine decarboxylase [Wolbachia endosymbiont of Menacanthus eurysternus]
MVNKEGYLFIVFFFVVTCTAFSISWTFGVMCFFPMLLCIYFFRDPVRVVPCDKDFILSPADGVISKIEEVSYSSLEESEKEEKFILISIFLNILNVHVNRIPISGIVKEMHYKKGRFISAISNKSISENEKQVVVVECENGKKVIVEQIAGLIARRVVCNLSVSQCVKAGERFGIIRFGSRVNIYVPINIEIRVSKGQTVVGGETIIADLSKEKSVKEYTFSII